MHVIAAKATCFQEAAKPNFVDYQKQVKANANAMANALSRLGFHIVSGGTDNHLLLIDLRPSHPEMTGKEAQLALEGANLTLNRNTVPGETGVPFKPVVYGLVLQRLPQEECWNRKWKQSLASFMKFYKVPATVVTFNPRERSRLPFVQDLHYLTENCLRI